VFNRATSNEITNTMKILIASVNRAPLRRGFFILAIALCCFALSPTLKAQCPSACGAGGNTAVGVNALDNVNPGANGINNTAVGLNALTNDTTGQYNVAVGSGALQSNTTGNFNMAIGAEALSQNNANFNLAIGFRVAYLNTTGRHLTGIGAAAMRNNTMASLTQPLAPVRSLITQPRSSTSLSVTRRWQISMAQPLLMALTLRLAALRSMP